MSEQKLNEDPQAEEIQDSPAEVFARAWKASLDRMAAGGEAEQKGDPA